MSNFSKTRDILEGRRRGSGIFGDFIRKDIKGESDLLAAMDFFSMRPYERLELFVKNMQGRPASQAGYKIIKQFDTQDTRRTDGKGFVDVDVALMKKSDTEYMVAVVGKGISRQLAFKI